MGKTGRPPDVHAVHDEFEHPGAEVLTEWDADGPDRDDPVGPVLGDEREGAAQCRLELFAGVLAQVPTRLDAARGDRVIVGVPGEGRRIVGLGIRRGDRGCRVGEQVLLDHGDGARRVPDQAANIPDAQCRLAPLRDSHLTDEIEKRVSRSLEVAGAGHDTIVAPAGWQDERMTAKRPAPTVLAGQFIRLEPLTEAHLPELHAAIGTPVVFAGGYGGGPEAYRADVDDFVAWGKTYFRWDTGSPFLVRVNGGPSHGVAVGTSTLGDFDEGREHAHIGWTAYDPRVWGSQVNAEAKLLMLGHAFDSGFGRVKIQTDILNERSQAAISGIGAVREGVVRRDLRRADGSWRDTVVFSILIDEWPDVRAGLQARLARWGDRPVEYRER